MNMGLLHFLLYYTAGCESFGLYILMSNLLVDICFV